MFLSGRVFLARYTRKNKTNLPANVNIKRRYNGSRCIRKGQRGGGLASLGRKDFGFLKGFAKSYLDK